MAYFLGVDGGASKTSCVVGDERTVLAHATAGSSNPTRVGEARAQESLAASIVQACTAAGISPSQIKSTCVGAAGSDRERVRLPLQKFVRTVVSGDVQVVGDMTIALQAAFGEGAGVILVAGSGSIAYGRNSAGETARAGGWGFAISDEGSGYWIGKKAITACLRASDEGGHGGSKLLAVLMKSLGADTREQLILRANASPSPDFASLFPTVLAAADSGDPIARAVLQAAAEELGGLALVVLKRLFRDAQKVSLAMSGGVFGNCAFVRQVFYNYLLSEFPAACVSETVVEPVLGALALARKQTQSVE
ncbi:MAG TPA: BadF/BadG/BcrA/BcrD ATPase family protein [Terriglobales bacterium]|nr:BadF/BadG/BcrA/BcrD ATPase family protein [Terriglobales bacterium]